MKRILIICYAALIAAFTLPFLLSGFLPEEEKPAEAKAYFASGGADESIGERISVLIGGDVREMDMTEYLTGVVAAEMPASFESEALRAQAVAARSYAIYCSGEGRHENADVCTNSGCCQAYLSEDELRERWGDRFGKYYEKVRRAVTDTAGEYLAYEGEAIFAAFHSSSAGKTESSGNVWNALPYLISVSSPESAESVPGYVSYVEVSAADFRSTLLSLDPEADFSGAEETWLEGLRLDESNRVASAAIGGREFDGAALRSAFKLRSTSFTLSYAGGNFLFTVTGYGHGVGMSQYGANVMAAQGASYTEILSHYYPGTELRSGRS